MRAHRFLRALAFALGLAVPAVFFGETEFERRVLNKAPAALATSSALAGAALAPSEELLCAKIFGSTQVKGIIGEAYADYVITRELKKTGDWVRLNPRNAPQGLDHLYIKYDKNGMPRDILVGETKYGTSQLGKTRDGLQGSESWIHARLKKLSAKYEEISAQGEIAVGKMRRRAESYSVGLRDNKTGTFWKDPESQKWFYDGPEGSLADAVRSSRNTGKFLLGAVRIRRRLYRVNLNLDEGYLEVNSHDLKNLSAHRKPWRISISKNAPLQEVKKNILEATTEKLEKKGLSHEEAKSAARKIVNKKTLCDFLDEKSSLKAGARVLGAFAAPLLAGILIDAGIRYELEGEIDASEMALDGAVMAGAGAASFFSPKVLRGAFPKMSLGMRGFIGGSAIGLGATFAISYGSYLTGNGTLREANIQMLSGGTGVLASIVLYNAAWTAVGMWGSASTGTAIATLHGAAATKAIVAWFGFGGFAGMSATTVGTIVLTGGTVVAAVLASGAVIYAVQIHDEKQEKIRTERLIREYKRPSIVEKFVEQERRSSEQ